MNIEKYYLAVLIAIITLLIIVIVFLLAVAIPQQHLELIKNFCSPPANASIAKICANIST